MLSFVWGFWTIDQDFRPSAVRLLSAGVGFIVALPEMLAESCAHFCTSDRSFQPKTRRNRGKWISRSLQPSTNVLFVGQDFPPQPANAFLF
ncbi:hypothetical protein ASF31_05460 [Brevundimonas sp. Leaf280]|nr:hypothetical protein ASF31_05460 [Brevundimonas sp. Leaf280]